MVVNVVNVVDIWAIEPECNPPISGNSNAPMPSQVAFQRMQTVARQCHIVRLFRRIQAVQYPYELLDVLRRNPPSVAFLVQLLEPIVPERLDHTRSITRNVTRYKFFLCGNGILPDMPRPRISSNPTARPGRNVPFLGPISTRVCLASRKANHPARPTARHEKDYGHCHPW